MEQSEPDEKMSTLEDAICRFDNPETLVGARCQAETKIRTTDYETLRQYYLKRNPDSEWTKPAPVNDKGEPLEEIHRRMLRKREAADFSYSCDASGSGRAQAYFLWRTDWNGRMIG
jgi:hypothetical protein